MNYLKALLRLKGGTGGTLLLVVLVAQLLGFEITEEQAGEFIAAVEEGGWALAAFVSGLMWEKAKREEDEKD